MDYKINDEKTYIPCFTSYDEAVKNIIYILSDSGDAHSDSVHEHCDSGYIHYESRNVCSDFGYTHNHGSHTIKFVNHHVDMDNIINNQPESSVPMLHFKNLNDLPWLYQGFSTRLGGVSTGIYETMNLGFYLEDSAENVRKNFEIIAKAIGVSTENMVYSKQTHTTNVLKVDSARKGMGVVKERDFDNIDGLITDTPELCLVTSFADCIPVVIADVKKHVVASLHSGWRGTVGNITQKAMDIMIRDYGCEAGDCIASVGPGICEDCYEVSSDVAEQFMNAYDEHDYNHIIKNGTFPDKYQLNLLEANRRNLLNAGIPAANISVADICTCCNPGLLHSHRATHGRRGLMCNFVYIKL